MLFVHTVEVFNFHPSHLQSEESPDSPTEEMYLQLTHVCEAECPEGQFETDGPNGVGRDVCVTRLLCNHNDVNHVTMTPERA